MFRLRHNNEYCKKGQNITEYSVLIVLVIAAFIATGSYVKRGIQGRWKDAVDELGDQYDPTLAVTDIVFITNTQANTLINTVVVGSTATTMRKDTSNVNEQKIGSTKIGSD